jgi:predicted permease
MSGPRWRRYLRFLRPDVAADVDDELSFHVDMRIAHYMREGHSLEEAERMTRERFGDPDPLRNELLAHDSVVQQRKDRRERLVDIWQDVSFAIRTLRRSPSYTAVAVLTLAIGIGANTALFSVVNGVLLRPLPYHAPQQLMSILSKAANGPMSVSVPDFMDWRAQSRNFSGLTAAYTSQTVLTGSGEPVKLEQSRVSANFFDVIGVRPVLGRTFVEPEEQASAPRVAMIGETLWRGRFGADSSIIGRTLSLDGFPTQVIGIVPSYVTWPQRSDIWMTTRFSDRDLSPSSRGARWLDVIARLRNGRTPEQANAELNAIAARSALEDSTHNHGVSAAVAPLLGRMTQTLERPLAVLLGAVGLVLLICCANVASLTLSRVASRRSELAVRKALGASRRRIVRQAMTEHVVLAAAGGLVGLAIAIAGVRLIIAISPSALPRVDDVSVNGTVLLFSLGVTLMAGLLFGIFPALAASGGAATLREGSRGLTGRAPRLRRAFVVCETAVAVVLLSGAGLLLRSLSQLSKVDPGFSPANLTTFGVALPSTRYGNQDQQRLFAASLRSSLARIPGVTETGISYSLPLSGSGFSLTFEIEGHAKDLENEPRAQVRVADAGYFKAMHIPLIRGRMFADGDRAESAPAIIISSETARRYFGSEDPIGKHVQTGWGMGGPGRFGGEIVGIVGDVRQFGLDAKMTPSMYMTYEQWPLDEFSVVVRASTPTASLIPAIRSSMRSIDQNLPVIDPRSYGDVVETSLGNRKFYLELLGAFAVIALVLAAIGTYGIMAYDVQLRRREMGIRLALGATGAAVVRMVVRDGLKLLAIGLVAGLVTAFASSKVLDSLLFGIGHHDLPSMLGAPLVLLLAGLAACVIPASRAGRMSPVETIRADS